MNKLFELNNIGLQEMVDEDGLDIYIAYTDDLLKKNLLIEFYEAEMEDSIETAIFVISCDEVRSYTFVLSVSEEVMKPLQVYRIVADAIEFIAKCNKATVLVDMEAFATGVSTSDDIENKKDRIQVFEQEAWKFNTAMGLINDRRNLAG